MKAKNQRPNETQKAKRGRKCGRKKTGKDNTKGPGNTYLKGQAAESKTKQ